MPGAWAVRWRNSVSVSASWPMMRLPSRFVHFGGRNIRLVPHLGEFDSDALWFRNLPYEVGVASWVGQQVADDYDVVVEIGANIGVYTCLFGLLASGQSRLKRVYAFEPSHKAFRRLKRNLDINSLTSVSAFQVAVGRESGFVDFFQPEDHLTNGSLDKGFASYFSNRVGVSTVVAVGANELANLLVPGERVLVKIDVEGFEAELLQALCPLVDKYNCDLIVEVLLETEAGIANWASENRYSASLLDGRVNLSPSTLIANSAHRDWLLQRTQK